MSWTRKSQEIVHRDFTEQAAIEPAATEKPRWNLDVWEITHDGKEREYSQSSARRVHSKAKLRVIMAPLDLAQRETKGLMVELFHKFGIPNDFSSERARSVNHSFAQRSNDNGYNSWFRVTGKIVDAEPKDSKGEAAFNDRQFGCFLQTLNDGSATIICFGAGPQVERSMRDFIKSRAWSDVGANPYILFDVVLEGLCNEADDAVWGTSLAFEPLEEETLELANSGRGSAGSVIPLAALHKLRKNMVDLSESLESCLLVVESIISSAGSLPSPNAVSPSSTWSIKQRELVEQQLKECLEYRRALLRSTRLRLSSLQRRVDGSIDLCSSLMAQQQSAAATQGPISIKLIAAIMMVFMPTITVATIVGSQLLVSEQDEKESSWDVNTTPLFYITWWVSIPLTVVVVAVALGWLWWSQTHRPTVSVSSAVRKVAAWRPVKPKPTEKDESMV